MKEGSCSQSTWGKGSAGRDRWPLSSRSAGLVLHLLLCTKPIAQGGTASFVTFWRRLLLAGLQVSRKSQVSLTEVCFRVWVCWVGSGPGAESAGSCMILGDKGLSKQSCDKLYVSLFFQICQWYGNNPKQETGHFILADVLKDTL